ncbi:putative reverse transcriptase domain, reverse transcriptase zinc-binding domain protein [Tanacetum coccineum]
MHGYYRDRGPPRCAFKIDIQKAYDTVDWRFLGEILTWFGFHLLMTKWIMACVTSTSFSIGINRDVHGFFKGKRGLGQGDPFSPYLFTLVMEVLTLILKRRVRGFDSFRYHKHCEELQLINVCFADDLFIFARGNIESARVIMESLEEFKHVSGLASSLPKSTTFFCNVVSHIKLGILNIMPFAEGTLPVIYLGVPLISSRLFNNDCKFLVEKAHNRIGDWKNKSLSFAGRLQLCRLVISSMHVYWASVLMIPTCILLDIEQLIRGFLWCNGELKRGKAKVAWNDICLPKSEGGLGIRSLEIFNIALGRSFWDVPLKCDVSWGWLKLLQLRDFVRPYLWMQIGNGKDISAWFDVWCEHCPLIHFLSFRDFAREGYTLQTTVLDLLSNAGWRWPQSWLLKAPTLGLIPTPSIDDNKVDVHLWRDSNGVMSKFSVKAAWEAFRPRGNVVPWQWDVGVGTNLSMLRCVFCDSQPDSHEHLFFECSYASKIWVFICHLTGMDLVPARLEDIAAFLQPIAHKRSALKRSPKELRDIIMVTVRLKLLTFRFKNTTKVNELLSTWNMPNNFRLYED